MTAGGPPGSAGGPPGSEDEALGIVEAGEAIGIPTVTLLLQGMAMTLAQPRGVARETRRLAGDTLRILAGKSDRAPGKGDRRFADPAWAQNPVYRRLSQEYLSLCESVGHLVDDLDDSQRSWQDAERARFVANIVMSAAAPTNFLLSNPAALKRAFDTGGLSMARGARQWWRDVRSNGGMPSQTDRTAFAVGTDLAITPGAVVDRDELAEIIQYTPTTGVVRRQPVLIIPPPIGRYYFLDLRPDRSFVEYAVSCGLQVFIISWRNPDASMGALGMEAYAARILSAMDVVSEICDTPELSTIGFCAGGILMSTVLNHLALGDAGRVRAASFAVTLLDFDSRAALGAFSAPRLLELAQKGNPKATYYINGESGAGPDAWFKSAVKQPGTWWEVWADWTVSRSGDEVAAPARAGSGAHPALEPAPGSYVRDRVPG